MENLKTWCVYCHTNKVNGKKYIGITGNKPTSRWNNGEGYKRCPRFYNAIKHYGWDAFTHEILYTGLTKEDAEQLEVDMIAKYKTQDNDTGYNLSVGGDVNCGFHRTDEFKAKLSASHKGLQSGDKHPFWGTHRSEETKERIRAANVGKPKSDYTRKKMSNSAFARWSDDNQAEREHLRELNIGANSAKAKRVVCIETNRLYDCIRDAERANGIATGGITRCCKGERRTAGGFHWAYAEAVSEGV